MSSKIESQIHSAPDSYELPYYASSTFGGHLNKGISYMRNQIKSKWGRKQLEDPLCGWKECLECENGFKLECDMEEGGVCVHKDSHKHTCDGCGRSRFVGVVFPEQENENHI